MCLFLCPLCKSASTEFCKENVKSYFLCSHCKAIFIDENNLPDSTAEIKRYREHNNDVHDIRYQSFVSPIVNAVRAGFDPSDKGLDYGAGTGPVISKLLDESNYQVKQYDPFFHHYPHLLEDKYDYIICCEVIEHFHHPAKEFTLLRKLLTDEGKLFCMTNIYDSSIDFKSWYYKNDPTHVFFYHSETLHYIARHFGFSDINIDNNLIILSS